MRLRNSFILNGGLNFLKGFTPLEIPKRCPKLKSPEGFTLIELLISICIFSIIAAALGGVLFSGVELWRRAQDVGYVQARTLLELEFFSRRLRQSLNIEEIPLRGDNVSIEFPTLTNNSLLKVRYIFDSSDKEFRYGKIGYQDILEQDEDSAEAYSESLVFKADAISFTYLSFDSQDNTYLWKDSLAAEEGMPVAIKINIEKDQKEFEKIVFIPIHEEYI